jgi:Reverse transcriptase (RNA-dependent DNA polymerase)
MIQNRKAIIKWKKQKGNAWQKQLQICNECLQWLDVQAEQRPLNDIEKFVRILIKERFQQLAMLEEQRWKQRAKRNWVKMGDKNTRYFHQIASHQKRKNHIDMIKEDGTLHYEHKAKADILHLHFCKMMGTEHQQTTEFDCTNFFTNQEVHMRDIQGDFTRQEIEEVIKTWPNNKAPGPDGYTGEFLKKFMDIMVPDMLRSFNKVLQSQEHTLEPINDSYIVLIPKKQGAVEVTHFRPISLINSMQKCFSKVLANRLRDKIQFLVMPVQTGFMKNRHINEGFLYAQEVVAMATRQKELICLFKADIYKAFDTISWSFLEKVLKAKGFSTRWIGWIKKAVLQGSSQVLLNSVAGRKIWLRRGVRQGDPLSPYLFVLAADFLPKWIQYLTSQHIILKSFPQCHQCLLYADDTLFIIKPEEQQINALKIIMQVYGQISGLQVSMDKSELMITSSSQERVQ